MSAQTAELENYSLDRYTDENGLPQNSVKSIAADHAGFIWLATENGLVRFDGQNFSVYNKFNLSISDNGFYTIQPSIQKPDKTNQTRPLIAMADGYESVKIQDGRALADPSYRQFVKSLPFADNQTGKTYVATGLPTYISEMYGKEHYIIPVTDRNETFYLCDSLSISFYKQGKKQSHIRFRNRFQNFFVIDGHLYYYKENGDISNIEQSSVGNLVLTGDILRDEKYKGSKKGITVYWNIANGQAFLYLNNNIYLLSAGQAGKMATSLLVRNFNLDTRNVHTFYYDKSSQSLFLGSVTEGLFVLRKRLFLALTTSGSERENVFYAHDKYSSNEVITGNGFVMGLDGRGIQSTSRHLAAFKGKDGDGRGVLVDKKNGAIYLKEFHFLHKFNAEGSKLLKTWDLIDEIKQIYLGKDGMIWLGMKKQGLYRLNPDGDGYKPEPFIYEGFKYASYITSKSKDVLLLGTENGIYEINLVNKKYFLLPGTEGMFIKSIHVSNPDEIWITSRDEGVMLYRHKQLVIFPLDKNKYLAPSHCIFEDLNGYFWVTTNKGLFKMRKQDLLNYAERHEKGAEYNKSGENPFYQYFDKRDGFLINEFNGGCQPCAVRQSTGYVSLPSLKGLIWFIPEMVKDPLNSDKIFFDKVEFNEKTFADLNDTVSIPNDAKRIRFYFSKPFFGNPDNLHFSYALIDSDLSGESPEWTQMNSSDLSVYFSALETGDYTLMIKSISGFGKENNNIRKIFVTVPPSWYETWWFKLTLGLIVAGLIYSLVQMRLYMLRQQNIKLERKIAERTRELEASRADQSKQLQIMSRLLASMSHDIQSPLIFIGRISSSVPKLLKKNELEEVSEIAELIKGSTEHMSSLISGLLKYIKAYVYGKSMNFEEVRLVMAVKDKTDVFNSINEFNGNRVIMNIPEDLAVYTDRQMLSIVLHNLIDNASKFTNKGLIKIDAYRADTGTHLVISNNGPLLPRELQIMFNQPSKTLQTDDSQGNQTGLGFFLVKEIAELIDVDIKVTLTETTNFHLIFGESQE